MLANRIISCFSLALLLGSGESLPAGGEFLDGVLASNEGLLRVRKDTSDSIEGIVVEGGTVTVPIIVKEESSKDLDQEALSSLGEPHICGYSTRLAGAESETGTDKKDWPWMALLHITIPEGISRCGGVLITRRHILTAAHCFIGVEADDVFVQLGEYDILRDNDTSVSNWTVKDIRTHEDYDPATNKNDISIVVLDTPVTYGRYQKPICLPIPGPRYENKTGIVAGWGTVDSDGDLSDVLLEVPVPIWEQETCISKFAQILTDDNLCAAAFEGGKDSCQGDSGGPLMLQRDDKRWMTVGVVSWGIGCAQKGKPGIYTRVNKYLPWIASKIQDIQ